MNQPTTASSSSELGCPKCHQELTLDSTNAVCESCGNTFQIDDGVLCTDRSGHFMGEFGAEKMHTFTESAKKRGWREVVEHEMLEVDPNAKVVLLNPDRATFADLLDTQQRNSVLDLGAGMGSISRGLSQTFEKVYAMDLAFERMTFLNVIAAQEKLRNISTICHRDVYHLPFKSNALSATVMIGVFEYFPLSYPDDGLKDVQARILREINRVIAPGGSLFIATKNRFGWPYWSGATDSSHLRFGSLLPRSIANIASKAFLKQPYRIITDSYRGYATLLKNAGFDNLSYYWPVDGYQRSKDWIDLSDKDAYRNAVKKQFPDGAKKTLLSKISNTPLFPHIVPHFGILARKSA